MDSDDEVKSTVISPRVTRITGLCCLIVGGVGLVLGLHKIFSGAGLLREGIETVVLGIAAFGLGVVVDRDAQRSNIMKARKEPRR